MAKTKQVKAWEERRVPENIVYNRAMNWLDNTDGVEDGIIAYCSSSPVWLTGTKSAFSWQTINEEDSFSSREKEQSIFEIKSKNNESGVYVGHLEIPIEQLPFLELNVSDSDIPYQLIITPWDAYVCDNLSRSWHNTSRIIYKSEELEKGGTITIDLEKVLHNHGYTTRYMRLSVHLICSPFLQGRITFKAKLISRAAVIAQLPIIRTVKQALLGIPVHAVVVDKNGLLIHGLHLYCSLDSDSEEILMEETCHRGIYRTVLQRMSIGNYKVKIVAKGMPRGSKICSVTSLRIEPHQFVTYDNQTRRFWQGGKVVPFLSGGTMFSHLVPVVYAATEKEKILFSQEEYFKHQKISGKSDNILEPRDYFALTTREIEKLVTHYAKSGNNCFKIFNLWPERCDAGGKISPYGAELLSHLFGLLSKNNMYATAVPEANHFARMDSPMTRVNGGYWRHNPVLEQYAEKGLCNSKGYTDYRQFVHTHIAQWTTSEPICSLKRDYYRHYFTLFKDDTRIAIMSMTSESDGEFGPLITNQIRDYVRTFDNNHIIFSSRSTSVMNNRTPDFDEGNIQVKFKERLNRVCWVATTKKGKSDIRMATTLKFFSLNSGFINAEGDCYAYPPWNSNTSICEMKPWYEEYRLLVRDYLWQVFLHRIPMALSWNEILVDDERFLPRLFDNLIDWATFEEEIPPVYINVDILDDMKLKQMDDIEEFFTNTGIAYKYYWIDDPLPNGNRFIVSDRHNPPYCTLKLSEVQSLIKTKPNAIFKKDGGIIPNQIQDDVIISLSKGYGSNFLLAYDRKIFLAFIRNRTNYTKWSEKDKGQRLRGNRKSVSLKIKINHLAAEKLNYILYDVDTKKQIKTGNFNSETEILIGKTNHDFALYVGKDPSIERV